MNFSVLLSLYIKEKPNFLYECLESLENQTVQATEIIIVYDGPITPELGSIVNKYAEKLPIKIVQLPKNVGMGNAFNEGLKNCSYEWVFRMDTDDICIPERFEKQINFIKQNPDIVLLGSHIAEFNDNIKDLVSYRKVPIGTEAIKRYSLYRSPFNLWLRIIAKGYKVENINDILVYARIGNNMIARRRGVNYIKGEWDLFKLKRELKLQNIFSGFFTFLLRVIPRILPTKILKTIYKFLRK